MVKSRDGCAVLYCTSADISVLDGRIAVAVVILKLEMGVLSYFVLVTICLYQMEG